MKIHWYAHSCFKLTADSGVSLITDPFAPYIGYTLPRLQADFVTVSHDHNDHNYLEAVDGGPAVLREEGVYTVEGIRVSAIRANHDPEGGKARGKTLLFVFEIDDMRVAHLGDLGEMPSEDTLERIGNVDVLFSPVGGVYTIGPRTACDIANATKTNVLVPMHFQTARLTLGKPLLDVDALLSIAKNCHIHKLNQSDCSITKNSLGDDRILVLDPSV